MVVFTKRGVKIPDFLLISLPQTTLKMMDRITYKELINLLILLKQLKTRSWKHDLGNIQKVTPKYAPSEYISALLER